MTAEMSPGPENQRLSAEDLDRVTFTAVRSFGRGYDASEVDAYLARCADEMRGLQERLRTLEEDKQRLQQAASGHSRDDVFRSVDVLMQAQRTADTTVAQADDYSARVMAEARSLYENARRKATEMVDQAHDMAEKAAAEKGEVEREATYLRTLRDVTRTQIETFLEGLLDHLTAEYGRASAGAAESAARPSSGDGRPSVTALYPEDSGW